MVALLGQGWEAEMINRYVSVSSGVVMQPLTPLASILELKGFAINTTLQIANHD